MASEAMSLTASDAGSEYNQVLFLDNDSTQIGLVRMTHPRIESIHIPESPDPKSQSLSAIISRLSAISGHDFTGNTYVERASRIRASRPQHTYDPVSGIQEKHVKQVDSWIQRTSGARALLMDWDRTITLFEGYFGDDEGSLPDDRTRYYEDLLLVLLGGAPRLDMIRRMIARAHEAGIELFVVTNNGGCNDPGSGFNNFVTHLFGSIPYTMVCGRDFGGHKGHALEADPRFSRMKQRLSISGGGRGATLPSAFLSPSERKDGGGKQFRSGHFTRRNRHTRRRRTVRFHRRGRN